MSGNYIHVEIEAIACLNVNSLLAHIDQLRIFLSIHKIDILTVNETKLDSSISSNEIHISGYDVVRRDRCHNDRHGGGVCIFIKNNLNFRIREDLSKVNLEFLAIEVCKPHLRPFLVATWYRPPNSLSSTFSAFQDVIDTIDAENLEFYLLGDINCDSLAETPDNRTKKLLNISTIYNLSQIISQPTRITKASKTLIDLCFTNHPDKVRLSGTHSLGISDHSLIYLIRKSNCQVINTNFPVAMRQFKNFNDEEFLNDLRQVDSTEVNLLNDPNDMWFDWLLKFSAILGIHAPFSNKRLRCKKSPWINSLLIQKMRERDSLKKRFDKNPNDLVWSQFKKARNEVNNLVKKTKRDYFMTQFNTAKRDPKNTWRLINEITSRKTSVNSNVKAIKQEGVKLTNSADITNTFNNYFTTIGDNLANKIPCSDVNPIFYTSPVNSAFSFAEISLESVLKTLKSINPNKASGPDNIPNKVLKMAAEILSPSLSAIFNRCLAMEIYPDDWKMARVLPIFKSGDKDDIGNYRPIPIIFGRLVHDQFYIYLSSNQLINPYQSGFRPTFSTLTSLLESTNNWCVNIDRGLLNGVVFIDLKKAFNTNDYDILLSKLSAYGVDELALTWFH